MFQNVQPKQMMNRNRVSRQTECDAGRAVPWQESTAQEKERGLGGRCIVLCDLHGPVATEFVIDSHQFSSRHTKPVHGRICILLSLTGAQGNPDTRKKRQV